MFDEKALALVAVDDLADSGQHAITKKAARHFLQNSTAENRISFICAYDRLDRSTKTAMRSKANR